MECFVFSGDDYAIIRQGRAVYRVANTPERIADVTRQLKRGGMHTLSGAEYYARQLSAQTRTTATQIERARIMAELIAHGDYQECASVQIQSAPTYNWQSIIPCFAELQAA